MKGSLEPSFISVCSTRSWIIKLRMIAFGTPFPPYPLSMLIENAPYPKLNQGPIDLKPKILPATLMRRNDLDQNLKYIKQIQFMKISMKN